MRCWGLLMLAVFSTWWNSISWHRTCISWHIRCRRCVLCSNRALTASLDVCCQMKRKCISLCCIRATDWLLWLLWPLLFSQLVRCLLFLMSYPKLHAELFTPWLSYSCCSIALGVPVQGLHVNAYHLWAWPFSACLLSVREVIATWSARRSDIGAAPFGFNH